MFLLAAASSWKAARMVQELKSMAVMVLIEKTILTFIYIQELFLDSQTLGNLTLLKKVNMRTLVR